MYERSFQAAGVQPLVGAARPLGCRELPLMLYSLLRAFTFRRMGC
jgi:hypothetical protein